MNLKKYSSRFLVVLAVAMLAFAGASCSDTETTDSTMFTIYYSGMTDIGPSMSGIVSSPTYKGSVPHDFAITQVTLKGEPFTGSCFTIHADNGSISINNTAGIAVGLYRISISCVSGGSTYEFKDAVEVNMMAPVPAGITVEPNKLKVDYTDIIKEDAEVVLPTAQVKTDGNHVSIRKYEIAESATSKFFAISQTGEISTVKGSKDILPGIYTLSLKLTTGASGKDEGIFENAVEINVTSKPLSLTYTPAEGKIEEETEGSTTFTTTAPVLKGSLEGVAYRIKSIAPATDKIRIDEKTGVLSVAAGHGFKAGEKYVVDVNVVNEHTQEGVDFAGVFTLETVAFIEPIENFAYENVTKTQATAFEIKHTDNFKGNEVTFGLTNLEASLQNQLSIDHKGTITAKKGNTIPLGVHTITVSATNSKGTKATSFALTIEKNKNFFTYISYGNNLSLPAETHASQYRVNSAAALAALEIAPTSDMEQGAVVAWSVKSKMNMDKVEIDNSGKLTFANVEWKPATCGMALVTATTGKGTTEEVSITVPVFVQFFGTVNKVSIDFTPFVLQVNPKNGGSSNPAIVTGVADASKFLIDYRRSFNFVNINGSASHLDGAVDKTKPENFMGQVWRNYYSDIKVTPNYGQKWPMSYYENVNKSQLPKALGYVDATTLSVVINPNKWVGEDMMYANGVMTGEMTFVTNGVEADINNGGKVSPIIIWFDEKF